jgi:hypothetical protein
MNAFYQRGKRRNTDRPDNLRPRDERTLTTTTTNNTTTTKNLTFEQRLTALRAFVTFADLADPQLKTNPGRELPFVFTEKTAKLTTSFGKVVAGMIVGGFAKDFGALTAWVCSDEDQATRAGRSCRDFLRRLSKVEKVYTAAGEIITGRAAAGSILAELEKLQQTADVALGSEGTYVVNRGSHRTVGKGLSTATHNSWSKEGRAAPTDAPLTWALFRGTLEAARKNAASDNLKSEKRVRMSAAGSFEAVIAAEGLQVASDKTLVRHAHHTGQTWQPIARVILFHETCEENGWDYGTAEPTAAEIEAAELEGREPEGEPLFATVYEDVIAGRLSVAALSNLAVKAIGEDWEQDEPQTDGTTKKVKQPWDEACEQRADEGATYDENGKPTSWIARVIAFLATRTPEALDAAKKADDAAKETAKETRDAATKAAEHSAEALKAEALLKGDAATLATLAESDRGKLLAALDPVYTAKGKRKNATKANRDAYAAALKALDDEATALRKRLATFDAKGKGKGKKPAATKPAATKPATAGK